MSSLRASFSEKKEEQRREREGMRAMEMHFSSHHDATGHDAAAAGDDDSGRLDAEVDALFGSSSKKSAASSSSFVSEDDLDREIDALFGNGSSAPPDAAADNSGEDESDAAANAAASSIKKVTIREPAKEEEKEEEFRPARIEKQSSARRLRARRQTIDVGPSAARALRASVCIGALPGSASASKGSDEVLSRPSVRKERRTYAMKCLRPQIRSDARAFMLGVEDLVRETGMLASLDHPHVIKLHGRAGCGSSSSSVNGGGGLRLSDGYFILLDRLVDTLDDRVRSWGRSAGVSGGGSGNGSGAPPALRQVRTARDVASALAYLHSRNVAFRDLKPANVGFDSRGQVKVFDFGFAVPVVEEDGSTPRVLYDVCGTPRYMAAEVALGTGYGLPADVHSFGILLWEVCALKKPFAKVRTREEFQRAVFERGARPKVARAWPTVLKDLMRGCWGSFPEERPTMARVEEVLRAHASELEERGPNSDSLRKSSVFRRLTG